MSFTASRFVHGLLTFAMMVAAVVFLAAFIALCSSIGSKLHVALISVIADVVWHISQ